MRALNHVLIMGIDFRAMGKISTNEPHILIPLNLIIHASLSYSNPLRQRTSMNRVLGRKNEHIINEWGCAGILPNNVPKNIKRANISINKHFFKVYGNKRGLMAWTKL